MAVPSAGKWLSGAVLALAAAWGHAQYPERAITMIVPFPPGGVADTVARPVAEALSRELGQSVVIENKAGAGGSVGIGQAARAAPDGYTVLMSLSSISILPEADKILGRNAAFQIDQFAPIARITADPTALVVRADAPWQTVQEFVADARRRPGALNYGSSGIYGSMHVPMEMFAAAAGIKLTHVPFTGAGPAVAALLGGQVDAISSGPSSVVQHIQAGKLRALAHWGDAQLAALPQAPTLVSQGYDVKFVQWSAIFVPAGTPAPVVERLRAAARKVANDPKVRQTILAAGSPVQYMDAPEFADYWRADAQSMARAVQRIGKVE
ncbi:tripartite tricarboxylate transporter substrate binding protein [Bordetella petrii]|uniref:tripartite tricarboxylate transporter substrate binding protein n=1 Tax=Bordetella petrii TaxID=94624 RepID=UPI00048D858C|nr:tripartite tricarboxylate transporter substrate binding protein [Bordetella petrii]